MKCLVVGNSVYPLANICSARLGHGPTTVGGDNGICLLIECVNGQTYRISADQMSGVRQERYDALKTLFHKLVADLQSM